MQLTPIVLLLIEILIFACVIYQTWADTA
jgi:hypothetical protein